MHRSLFREYITYISEEAIRFEDHKYKSKASQTVGLLPSTNNNRFESIIGDKLTKLRKKEAIMKNAAVDDAKVILFPEFCLTGYFI